MPQGNNLGAMRAPTLEEERARLLEPIKDFRKQIDGLIGRVSTGNGYERGDLLPNNYQVREVARQVELKLIEAKMWAGKMLEGLGNPFPAELADRAKVQ